MSGLTTGRFLPAFRARSGTDKKLFVPFSACAPHANSLRSATALGSHPRGIHVRR